MKTTLKRPSRAETSAGSEAAVTRERKEEPSGPKLCLFGAAPNTGNLGVSALCASVLSGLARRLPDARITVFDYGEGLRDACIRVEGREIPYQLCGGFYSRRFYRPESLFNMRFSAWLGGGGNAGAEALMQSDAVLDISGGDSFTDLYGPKRFWAVALPKLISMEQRRRLILLPQTYGPFRSTRARRTAERIVRSAESAWARDPESYWMLKELLNQDYDPSRHHSGVDVAFALEPAAPRSPLPGVLEGWLSERSRPTIGFNVSGLLYNFPDEARERYGLRADYRETVIELLRRFLERSDVNVLLVPHVIPRNGANEADAAACEAVRARLADKARGRIVVLPPVYDPSEVKWIVRRLDWFCGTRMHSTIAGLSSGVPTAAMAYSMKTRGVFETCGVGDSVADLRALEAAEVVEYVWGLWEGRAGVGKILRENLKLQIARAQGQLDAIASACLKSNTRSSVKAR